VRDENLIIMENNQEFGDTTRREVLRKAVFITPLILTLPVIPSVARAGSSGGDEDAGAGGSGGGGGRQSDGGRRRRRRRGFWDSLFGS
jgi:hypothetical protein